MTFAGQGRDRLCIRGGPGPEQAALIVYAEGSDANCSVRGDYRAASGQGEIRTAGDTCRVLVTGDPGSELRLNALDPSCSYYCGPKASFAGKAFRRTTEPVPVTDAAGDPLC
jgi:hypothetical protein